MLAKAGDYWLDRFDLLNESGSLITGMNYADQNAVLPARGILTGIAVICAILFFVNVWRRTWLLSAMGLAMLVLSSILIGMIWPGVVQQFSVDPTEADKEAPYIGANIEATRAAYDLADIEVKDYTSSPVIDPDQQSVLDAAPRPRRWSTPSWSTRASSRTSRCAPTTRWPTCSTWTATGSRGRPRARPRRARARPERARPGSRNWSNLHTVYTHGNGMIAAYANQRPEDNVAQAPDVQWAEGQDAEDRALTNLSTDGYETRVYYGEKSPDYSIVGKSSGGRDVELDLPSGTLEDAGEATTTYDGAGGVGIGSLFRQVLYAVKFGEPNLVLSERVNSNSKILYDRNPGDMVKKVAPWLTVDSDPYPAVVDGKIQWILDGYTTTDQYPQAQRASFDEMTDDSLRHQHRLPDAAHRRDQLHAQRGQGDRGRLRRHRHPLRVGRAGPDPQGVALGVPGRGPGPRGHPRGAAEPPALPRGPDEGAALPVRALPRDGREGLLRGQLPLGGAAGPQRAQQQAAAVPDVREQPGSRRRRRRTAVTSTAPEDQVFSLTSVYVPRNKNSLAAYMAVNSDATDEDFGQIQVFQLPNEATNGPRLAANQISSDQGVRDEVFKFTNGAIRTYSATCWRCRSATG